MKKVFLITILFTLITLGACEEGDLLCPSVPGPQATPDDTSIYEDTSSGYKSVTYTYYCLNFKYQAVTWTRSVKCGAWFKSVFTSTCI